MKSSSKTDRGGRRSSRTPWILIGVGLPVLLIGGYAVSSLFGDASASGTVSAATYTVRRGPLRVSVVEKGDLNAIVSQDLRSEIEGQTTILKIAPEGERVKKGTVVVELDASSLEERRAQQEISLARAEADFIAARESHEIQKNQNLSSIEQAEQEVDFAEMDLQKFEQGDKKQEREQLEARIKLAEQDVARAQDKVQWSEQLAKDGYISRLELEGDRLALNKAELDYNIAKTNFEVLTNDAYGTQAKMKLELDSRRKQAIAELEREKRKASANEAQSHSNLKAREAMYNLEKQRYDKMVDQIAKAKMTAPSDGIVVYATTSEGRRGGDDRPIEEGASVRERQLIISLPDVSRMKAVAKIHESVFDKVRSGQTVLLKVDAFGDRIWTGEVSKVAIVPDSGSSWLNPDLKVYSTEILLDGETTALRPGMSVSCEIIVADLEDAVQIPIQSIFRRRGEYVAFVQRGDGSVEERPITIGVHNERLAEVKEGLEESEIVFLRAPDSMTRGLDRESGLEGDSGGREMPEGGREEPRARPPLGGGEPEVRGFGPGGREGGGVGVPEGMGSDFFERMRNNEITDEERAKFEEWRKSRAAEGGGFPGGSRRRGGDGAEGGRGPGGDGGGRGRDGRSGGGGSPGARPAPEDKQP